MKKAQKFMLMIVGMAFVVACGSNDHEGDLHLNGSEKWVVNSEMKPHIERGDELLKEFISTEDKDFARLAKDLQEENTALIKSCTMKGEAHDELHKWLHPHMELIEELSKAKDFNDAEEMIAKLEVSFETYHKYFQ